MKQRIILFGLILVGTVTFAQSPVEKGLNTINRSSAEATIGFLASNELQGREAGFHGSYVSSEYIASILQWMGIQPLNEATSSLLMLTAKSVRRKDVWKFIRTL